MKVLFKVIALCVLISVLPGPGILAQPTEDSTVSSEEALLPQNSETRPILGSIIPRKPIVLLEMDDRYICIEVERGRGVGKYTLEPEDSRKNNGESFLRVMVFRGFNISQNFSLGVGVGGDFYKEFTLVPIMTDFRFQVVRGPISPIAFFHFGYGSGLFDDDYRGGFLVNGGVGLRVYLQGWTSLHLGFGYHVQRITSKSKLDIPENQFTLKFVGIRTGITF